MKIKCDYCGCMVPENETNCPNCGATISGVNRMAAGVPRTISELQRWYADRNLPPQEVTRFFIGIDYRKPKAFGIYKDKNGDFIVYKNKADGSRVIRYQGTDEAYAVNELYMRLKEEILNQKEHNVNQRGEQYEDQNIASAGKKRRAGSFLKRMVLIMMISFLVPAVLAISMIAAMRSKYKQTPDPRPSAGYYSYDGTDYYRQGNDWYYYDEKGDDWGHTVEEHIPAEVANDVAGEYKTSTHEGMAFEDSFWYHEPTEESSKGGSSGYSDDYDYDRGYDSNDSWDSDYNWDSNDTWDSDYSDWDSDW